MLQRTVGAYDAAVTAFDAWLRARDVDGAVAALRAGTVVTRASLYLRQAFASQSIGLSGANALLAGLSRLVRLAQGVGATVAPGLNPIRRPLRSWELSAPHDFKQPIPKSVALALAVRFWLAGP